MIATDVPPQRPRVERVESASTTAPASEETGAGWEPPPDFERWFLSGATDLSRLRGSTVEEIPATATRPDETLGESDHPDVEIGPFMVMRAPDRRFTVRGRVRSVSQPAFDGGLLPAAEDILDDD